MVEISPLLSKGQLLLTQRRAMLRRNILQTPSVQMTLGLISAENATPSQSPLDNLRQRLEAPQANTEEVPEQSKSVRAYPSLLIGMIKHGSVSAGRIWLLLRSLDAVGRGWVHIETAREQLTGKNSPLRTFGWRRLRQVLQRGRGEYWTRDAYGRIWLSGAASVASSLSISRLDGTPVLLPLESLVHGIEATKAAFYAAFHASRKSTPITRATQRNITGVSERSQRTYDHIAGVQRVHNFDITQTATEANAQEHSWQFNRASFRFTDYLGKQGDVGSLYNAQRLPNSYRSPLEQAASGRTRHINRSLQVLVTKGVQGNSNRRVKQLFYTNATCTGGDIPSDAYMERRAYDKQGREFCVWTRV